MCTDWLQYIKRIEIQWCQHFYNFLPFGLCSAPFLSNCLSDIIHWVLQHNYKVAHLWHYPNNFFTAGHANTDDCNCNAFCLQQDQCTSEVIQGRGSIHITNILADSCNVAGITNITWKELFVIFMAVHTRVFTGPNRKIAFHCENQTVVDIWEKSTTHGSYIMALVRLLNFRAAHHNTYISVCVCVCVCVYVCACVMNVHVQ